MKTYLVGGAVRDQLLGRPAKDMDYVVVGAEAHELIAKYGAPVGDSFPVFLDRATGAEIAMARRERKTAPGYHGFAVEFGSDVTLEDDLVRRDLTINAMAQDVDTGEIIDPYGGLRDLHLRVLRHTSHAFSEDPLRVVRLARFAARYTDFSIAPETLELCTEVIESGEMDSLPHERYWREMEKVMCEDDPFQFFEIIHMLGGFTDIEFFSTIFLGVHYTDPGRISRIARSCLVLPEEDRLMHVVALNADNTEMANNAIRILDSECADLHDNVLTARSIRRTVDAVFDLMKQAGAWSQGREFDNLICAMGIDIENSCQYSVSPAELTEAKVRTAEIKAAMFPDLKGKDIGLAITAARKQIIKEILE